MSYNNTDVEVDAANTLRWSEVMESKEIPYVENAADKAREFNGKAWEDALNRSPKHYGGTWVVADFIREQKLDFLLGNVVKYLCRAPHKGTELQDLRKAIHYLEKRIADLTKDSLNNTDK